MRQPLTTGCTCCPPKRPFWRRPVRDDKPPTFPWPLYLLAIFWCTVFAVTCIAMAVELARVITGVCCE